MIVRLLAAALRWRLLPLLLLPFITTALRAADPFPGLDDKWRHIRSTHFEVYSRTSESYARTLLVDLEKLRATFVEFLELPVSDSTEVSVFVFRSGQHFKAYVSPHNQDTERLIGEYRTFYDRELILLPSDQPSETVSWVVSGNLAMSLLGAGTADTPAWLRVGLGMFFGNFDATRKEAILGRPDSLRENIVRKNPTIDVEELFVTDDRRVGIPALNLKEMRDGAQDSANLFHARAWVLLHYWYCGQKDVPISAVNNFLKFALESGREVEPEVLQARFESTFKVDYAEMSRRVSRYMKAGRYFSRRVALKSLPAADTFLARQVDAVEMRERLAEVRLRTQRDSIGNFVMIDALGGPRAARAAEALGNDALARRDFKRGQEYWETALAAGSTNPAVLRLATRLEFARWFSRYDYYFRLIDERAAKLRELLLRCIERFPEEPVYYEMLAWVESAAPAPSVSNVNLVQRKFSSEALTARQLLGLALARARLGDRAGAMDMLKQIEGVRPGAAERRFAENVLRILEALPPETGSETQEVGT